MNKFFFLVLLTISSTGLWANIKLPALVSDNMVLQRDAKINLWGWADAGEKVIIQFQKKQLSTKAGEDGKWSLVLDPLPAGGPYDMVIKGKNTITIKNILIGDVWLASGQSNMELSMNVINNSKQEIDAANYPKIRLFTVDKKIAYKPKVENSSDGWKLCSPETVDSFSAVAFLFARNLFQDYKVPIGIIHSSWGGTPAEAWTSAQALQQFPNFAKALDVFSNTNMEQYDTLIEKSDLWNKDFAGIDRGRMANGTSWADINIDTVGWRKMKQPRLWSMVKELKGYSGVIWLRKEINVPVTSAGKPLEISLGTILERDSIFFNGQFVGHTEGYDLKRFYAVSGNLVNAGTNVITLRVVGFPGYGGLMGKAEDMYAKVEEDKIPLTGDWIYNTGPDITNMVELPKVAGYTVGVPQTPAVLYNAMIAPLIPYSIKGVIWYQGEANAGNIESAKQYYSLFPAMIKDWRQRWGYDFPFLYVQLAGFSADKPEPADYAWAHLREAQYKTLALPNTGMATAIDIGEEKDIHPKNKQDVAKRLALVAEKVAYGESIISSGPTYNTMKIEGDKVRLSFDNIGSGLWVKDTGLVHAFAIADADKKFVWAKAVQQGNEIVVSADSVTHPVAVRYNWLNTPVSNLYNKENLPAVPFRTDDW